MEEAKFLGGVIMTKHVISDLKDFDISRDGRNIVLNFSDDSDRPVSLKLTTIALEKISHEIGLAITKAREFSDISKQGIVRFLRPAKSHADLMVEGSTVLISFVTGLGLAVHYGLEPNHADALAHQILDASERGKKAKPQSRH
jgi:hypothetical protein